MGILGPGSIYYTIMNIRLHCGVLCDIGAPWTLWLRVFPHVHKTNMVHKLIMEALGKAELNEYLKETHLGENSVRHNNEEKIC